jgi:endonuclease G
MHDLRSILTKDVREEFLDRFPELTGGVGGRLESLSGGLEGLDSVGLSVDQVAEKFTEISESPSGTADLPPGLEAIIIRFGRPAFFVKKNTFDVADTPSSSETVNSKVTEAKARIEKAIPGVGRINLRDHAKSWVGTGWLLAPNLIVTNRHVARDFAESDGAGAFPFNVSHDGRVTKADLDLFREHQSSTEVVFRLPKVLWIEPSQAGHHDVAFLAANEKGTEGEAQPVPLKLMTDAEFGEVQPGRWLAVIGYPGFSPFNDAQDQQRIFQGVFSVKRMQPGTVRSSDVSGQLYHDATTLGGNSGSLVLDLETGKAVALHFGGYEGQNNYAVIAPVLRKLVRDKLGIELA